MGCIKNSQFDGSSCTASTGIQPEKLKSVFSPDFVVFAILENLIFFSFKMFVTDFKNVVKVKGL